MVMMERRSRWLELEETLLGLKEMYCLYACWIYTTAATASTTRRRNADGWRQTRKWTGCAGGWRASSGSKGYLKDYLIRSVKSDGNEWEQQRVMNQDLTIVQPLAGHAYRSYDLLWIFDTMNSSLTALLSHGQLLFGHCSFLVQSLPRHVP